MVVAGGSVARDGVAIGFPDVDAVLGVVISGVAYDDVIFAGGPEADAAEAVAASGVLLDGVVAGVTEVYASGSIVRDGVA